MASFSRGIIDQAIIKALTEAGCVALALPSVAAHPRRYATVRYGVPASIWVYCWTLTPGGRPTLPHEYRIQMTSVQSPLAHNPDGYTLLLGYEPNRDVFAAYDIGRHTSFTTGSPSVQVNVGTLNDALQNGLSFEVKSNDEIVIGVRNDLLFFYAEHAQALHEVAEDPKMLEIVERVGEEEGATELDIAGLTENRQRVVRETYRWTRSSSFRKQVLSAYENRCAVTRHQMGLVEAAHILPVSAGTESVDDVRNGIALSPTYHRAFDNGVIFLDTNMEMRINQTAISDLAQLGLDGGVEEFSLPLGKVHLPQNNALRPDPSFIQLANEYRGLLN